MTYSLSLKTAKTPENLSRRERLNLQQRDEILKTALRLFSEKSYPNVSMHDIAREAEFGMGTLYKFFSSKEDLYKSLILQMAEKWHHNVMQALEQERNPVRAIEKCVTIHRELFFDNLPFVRLFFAGTQGAFIDVSAGFEGHLRKFRDEYLKKLASIFKRGIKANVFRDVDPHHMALALYGIILTFLLGVMEDPAGFRKGEELSTVSDIFLRGVLST
ncbi:MAG: TetR/AcrR family transcriptional regulator [Desulfomonilaceae bacterium]